MTRQTFKINYDLLSKLKQAQSLVDTDGIIKNRIKKSFSVVTVKPKGK